ncbi:MAG: T9SS type A sorting domain-containing protein [Bacteroidales bacterium]|nr:T9SS type A sorting domain-containing protein [Bacteroidales bacterium]
MSRFYENHFKKVALLMVMLLVGLSSAFAQTQLRLTIECHGRVEVFDRGSGTTVTTIQGPVENSTLTLAAGQLMRLRTVIPSQITSHQVTLWDYSNPYFGPPIPPGDPLFIHQSTNDFIDLVMGANGTAISVVALFEVRDPNITITDYEIESVTKTPVILPFDVTYDIPDNVNYSIFNDPVIGPVVADLRMDIPGGFPAGAELIKVSLDGGTTNLLNSAPTDIGGATEIFLYDLLSIAPPNLITKEGLTDSFEFTFAGIDNPVTIPFTITVLGYVDFDVCYTDFEVGTYTLTFADATVVDITDFETCWNVPYSFEYEIGYPTIYNVDSRVKNDAVIEVDVPLNAGTVVDIFYNNNPAGSYTLSAEYSTLYLSAMLANDLNPTNPNTGVQTTLQGHVATDTWRFEIDDVQPGTYNVEVTNFAYLEGTEYAYAGDSFQVIVNPEPAIGFSFDGVLAETGSSFEYCYDYVFDVTLSHVWAGEPPFTLEYQYDDGVTPVTGTFTGDLGDVIFGPGTFAVGTYTITLNSLVDNNGCSPTTLDPWLAFLTIHPEPEMDFFVNGALAFGQSFEFCYDETIELSYEGTVGAPNWDFTFTIDKIGGGVGYPFYGTGSVDGDGDIEYFEADMFPLGVGTYSLTITSITDGNNCVTSATTLADYWMSLIVHPEPTAEIEVNGTSASGQDFEFCYNEVIDIYVAGVVGEPDWTLGWQIEGPSGFPTQNDYMTGVSETFTYNLLDFPVGLYTFTVTSLVDNNMCAASQTSLDSYTFTITINPEPTALVEVNDEPVTGNPVIEFCYDDEVTISIEGVIGTAPWTVEWQIEGPSPFGTQTDIMSGVSGTWTYDLINFPTGTYLFSILDLYDDKGCHSTSLEDYNFSIIVHPEPVVSAIELFYSEYDDLSDPMPIDGDLANGYTACINDNVDYYYIGVASLTVAVDLEPNYPNPFFIEEVTDPAYWAWWLAKGVDGVNNAQGWELAMWDIINGDEPIFFLEKTGSDYFLYDGLQYPEYLMINGDYPPGTYTFTGTVESTEGCLSDVSVVITFLDDPNADAGLDDYVCFNILEYNLDATYSVVGSTGKWTTKTPAPGNVVFEDDTDPKTKVTVDVGGVYTFYWTETNGICEDVDEVTITFYTIVEGIGGVTSVFSGAVETYSVAAPNLSEPGFPTYSWSAVDPMAVSISDPSAQIVSLTFIWDDPLPYDEVELSVTVDNGLCSDTYTITIEILPNLLVGQVKYYNAGETPMPSPFMTNYYGLNVPDFFYVSLVGADFDLESDDPYYGAVEVKKVEEYYGEDLHPLLTDEYYEAAFAFDYNLDPNADYRVLVWDGGYYEEWNNGGGIYSDGFLTNNWTYNNWDGVNATDAMLVEHMVIGNDISGFPGLAHIDYPYAPYNENVADANYNGTLTGLDALLAKRRAIGLIQVYPNDKPNFEVAGIFVDEDDFNTNTTFGVQIPTALDKLNMYSYIASSFAGQHYYFNDLDALANYPDLGYRYLNIYYDAVSDINSSYVPVYGGFKAEPKLDLIYEGVTAVSKGEEVTIPIVVDHFADLGAISIGMTYRNDLIEVIATNYGEDNAYFNHEQGIVNIAWSALEGINFNEGDAIAMITVRVIGDISADARLFELTGFTELADRSAQVVEGVNLKASSLSTEAPVINTFAVTNNPNPFRDATTITYDLPESGAVSVVIYNKMGQVVKTLVTEYQSAGTHKVTVQSSDLNGPGVYYYKLEVKGESNDYSSNNSMILIR